MPNSDAIIYGCSVNGDGSGTILEGDALSDLVQDDALAWVHLVAKNPEARDWLKTEVSYLDPIIIDALLAEETRPRMVEFEQGVLLILRGVNLNENSDPEDMISVRLWIDSSRVISLQRRPLKATKDLKDRLLDGKGPKNSGDFLASLCARLFERMEPVFSALDEALDSIEESVIENPDIGERQKITSIRKEAIIYRRYIAPQRDVLAHLRTSELPWLDAQHKRRLQESFDRVVRYLEDLDAIRERAAIVKDELASVLADKMNKNMYVLSVIAAIFLPLGFLTGLLGINVGGIPGAENSASFLIFCAILSVIVILQILLFKKMKWF